MCVLCWHKSSSSRHPWFFLFCSEFHAEMQVPTGQSLVKFKHMQTPRFFRWNLSEYQSHYMTMEFGLMCNVWMLRRYFYYFRELKWNVKWNDMLCCYALHPIRKYLAREIGFSLMNQYFVEVKMKLICFH